MSFISIVHSFVFIVCIIVGVRSIIVIISPWLVIIGASRFENCWNVVFVVCMFIVGFVLGMGFWVICRFSWIVIHMDWLYRGHRIGVGPVNISKAKCIIRAIVAGTMYSFSFVFDVRSIRGIVAVSIRGREWVCDLCMCSSASMSGSSDMRDAMNAFLGFTPSAVRVT